MPFHHMPMPRFQAPIPVPLGPPYPSPHTAPPHHYAPAAPEHQYSLAPQPQQQLRAYPNPAQYPKQWMQPATFQNPPVPTFQEHSFPVQQAPEHNPPTATQTWQPLPHFQSPPQPHPPLNFQQPQQPHQYQVAPHLPTQTPPTSHTAAYIQQSRNMLIPTAQPMAPSAAAAPQLPTQQTPTNQHQVPPTSSVPEPVATTTAALQDADTGTTPRPKKHHIVVDTPQPGAHSQQKSPPQAQTALTKAPALTQASSLYKERKR